MRLRSTVCLTIPSSHHIALTNTSWTVESSLARHLLRLFDIVALCLGHDHFNSLPHRGALGQRLIGVPQNTIEVHAAQFTCSVCFCLGCSEFFRAFSRSQLAPWPLRARLGWQWLIIIIHKVGHQLIII